MDARGLALETFDTSLQYFLACLDGIPESALEDRLTDQGMTARDMAFHLAECRSAIIAKLEGREHAWGSFQPEEGEGPAECLKRLHDPAKAAVSASEDAMAAARMVMDYGVMHDNFHVGQLVLLRLRHEPDWNSLSIYG